MLTSLIFSIGTVRGWEEGRKRPDRTAWILLIVNQCVPEAVANAAADIRQVLMDIVSREKRSAMMAGIGSRNTRPELAVRRAAHRLGLRFRLHRRDLPGSPDLVFPKWRTALFVHGCYWHRHSGCSLSYTPKSNVEFWLNKFQINVNRDKRTKQELENMGWQVVVIWECETKNEKTISEILNRQVCNAAG